MIWELEKNVEVYVLMEELIKKHHQHLAEAKIVLYACEKVKSKGQNIVLAEAAKASTKMKASMNADFTITIYTVPWSDLTPEQKRACLDHELCHCEAAREPEVEVVGRGRNGKDKTKIIKDKYGRTQFTDKIKRGEDGEAKWVLKPHNLEEFRDIVSRHGIWDEAIRNFKEVLDKKDASDNATKKEQSTNN